MAAILDEAGGLLLDEGGATILDEASTTPNVYTYNFCTNPSFEVDLTGVFPAGGATAYQNATTGLYGAQCLTVSTPGQNPSEGVLLPPGTVLDSGTGAVSFFLQGFDVSSSGTLSVFVVDTTSSTTLGSATITFNNTTGWSRYSVQDLNLVAGHTIIVSVWTNSAQQTAFNIDGVQYEPATGLNDGVLPTPYIDGDQPFGFWTGTRQESPSYKLYQNQISAAGGIRITGYGSLLQQGASFKVVNTDPANGPTQVTGNIDLSGKTFIGLGNKPLAGGGTVVPTGITVGLMFAGLDDFSIFQAGDIDPAISLVGYNNTGVLSGTNTGGSAGYTRPYATFSAPQAFQGSTGKNIWNTAAYFAMGYEFASIANNVAQNITHAQAELIPGSGVPPVPSTYVRPRALTATLAPTRLNYVPNPSFEVSTAQWTALNGTLTRVAGGAITGSSWAGQIVTTFTNSGIYIPVPFLIVGEEYTASVYVKPTTATGNITLTVNGTSTSVAPTLNAWQRITVTFIATQSNPTLAVFSAIAGTFLVDAVMLEVGGALNAYADGSFSGWNWEVAGSAGLTRSYYYVRGNIAYAATQSVLNDHLPLGLHAYAPVFNSPPTQYS